jgi:sugar O-acyltransferase (sialic acid O-acetyltransferase NeuD family)
MPDNNITYFKGGKLVLIGNGGHARSCREIINSFRDYSISLGGRINVGAIVNDSRKVADEEWRHLAAKYTGFVIGIGQIKDPQPRIGVYKKLKSLGARIVTLISPRAYVSPDVTIGEGTVIMPNATVNAGAIIGDCCIINTGAIIEHDAEIGDFCHISTGAIINGTTKIGNCTFVGSNATVFNNIEILPYSIVRAGQTERKGNVHSGSQL